MRKLTVKEFFESKEMLAVKVPTLEKAQQICKAFDKAGYKWTTGYKYLDHNNWRVNNKDTCYSNKGTYSDSDWYDKLDYEIIELILEEERKK